MPAVLKGNAKVKLEKDYKAGEEVELAGVSFEADQDDFERMLRGRLDQQQRKHDTEKADLTTKLEAATKAAPAEKGSEPSAEVKALQDKLAALEASSVQTALNLRLDNALAQAGLKLPKELRSSLKLKADATDEDIDAAVKQGTERLKALKAEMGVKEGEEAEETAAPTPIGRTGSAGSRDKNTQRLGDLEEKAKRFRPNDAAMLAGMDNESRLEVLKDWEAQGLLVPDKK